MFAAHTAPPRTFALLARRRTRSCCALDPDNNEAERAIRTIAVGRKNRLFCGSDGGGRTAATLVSICSGCRGHGVDPWAYMRDVLVRVSVVRDPPG